MVEMSSPSNPLEQYLLLEKQRLSEAVALHRQEKEAHAQKELEASIQLNYLNQQIDSLVSRFKTSRKEALDTENLENEDQPLASSSPGNFQEISPDTLRRPEFQGGSLIDVAVAVADTFDRPFTADDATEQVYLVSSEEERKACKRSLSASLSRAALDGVIKKVKRGTFASKNLIEVQKEVLNGLVSPN